MNKRQLPFLLILFRLVAALVIPLVAFTVNNSEWLIVSLIISGLVSDVFDGIIARKLNVATEKLRVYDSNVDLIFWISVIVTILVLNRPFLAAYYGWMLVVIGLELAAYLVSFLKFGKTVATHTILAKIWTLTLCFFLIDLALNHTSSLAFWSCIGLGILSRLEIIGILLLLKHWATDVPSIFAVDKVNRVPPES